MKSLTLNLNNMYKLSVNPSKSLIKVEYININNKKRTVFCPCNDVDAMIGHYVTNDDVRIDIGADINFYRRKLWSEVCNISRDQFVKLCNDQAKKKRVKETKSPQFTYFKDLCEI